MWYKVPCGNPPSFGRIPNEYIAPPFSPLSRLGGSMYFSSTGEVISARVIDVQVIPLDSDPIGAAVGGYITLSRPVLPVLHCSTRLDDSEGGYVVECYGPSGGLVNLP